jgi:AcrR family transcriptional regulator
VQDTAVQRAPEPQRKGGRKRDDSRDPEILQAVVDVLAEVGYDGMTIDMVATRAKAGKATLYRRWASKGEMVLDAVSCMKPPVPAVLPDTGTLRGDLVAMIRPHAVEDGDRKTRIMAGMLSVITKEPELADAVHAAITEPRARANRVLIQRAIDRGEVAPGVDVDTLAQVMPAMTAYRKLVLRAPVDRDYLISLVDGVLLPALGVAPRTGDTP